jgi:hypothetical protein
MSKQPARAAYNPPPVIALSDEALTTRETSRLTKLSERALEGLRYKGGGPPYIKISTKAVRYLRSDVFAWLSEKRRTSTSDPGTESTR